MGEEDKQNTPKAGPQGEPRGMALWRKNLRQKYGKEGAAPQDDDALAERSMADYDTQHEDLKKYRQRDKDMDDLFERQPQSAAFLMAMAKDGDKDTPASRVRDFFGDDLAEMILDKDVDDEKLDKAFRERQANLERTRKEEEQDKAAWRALMERWQKSHESLGLTVDEANESLQKMEDFVERFITGKLTDGDLVFFHKGAAYDKDIASTREEAALDARNSRLDEAALRRRKEKGTGLPSLSGKSKGGAEGKPLRGGAGELGNLGPGIWDA